MQGHIPGRRIAQRVLSVCTKSVLSYANVIKCANGETLQILRGCNHAETAKMKSNTMAQKVRLNRFTEDADLKCKCLKLLLAS